MKPTPRLFQPSGLNSHFHGNATLSFAEYIEKTRQMIAKARIDLTPETTQSIPIQLEDTGFVSSSSNTKPGGFLRGKCFASPLNSNRNTACHPNTSRDFLRDNALTENSVLKGERYILDANSPREWLSTTIPKQGLLLIHGLYDSPFMVKDLGDYFAKQGLLVRSILLPGHATVPGDLLNVHHSEWLKAVDYGVETLAKEVDDIFILGFSLGGVLALHKALSDTRIKGLLLISPALRLPKQWLIGFLSYWQRWVQWIVPNTKWYKKRSFQKDTTKYESFTCNAARQIYQLIVKTQQRLKQHTLSIPVFLAISAEDEVICPKACLDFFTSQPHPKSELLWYARHHELIEDNRANVKSSFFPEEKILDFSHICLTNSPDNPHYGQRGDYRDFLQYADNKAPRHQEIFLGAVSEENRKRYVIQRLSYNPDFKEMTQKMGEWLLSSTR
jgi:esterase/lipase